MKTNASLTSLKFFRQAAESLSFKVAAEKLFVSQAAVSQQIKSLEENLGVKLFRRLNREVILTEEGKQLLPFVVRGFTAFDEGFASLQDDLNPDLLNITALPSFSSRWLMPKLVSFQQQYPDISIRISPSLKLESFAEEQLDIAVRYGRGGYTDLKSVLLHHDYLLPVCHPDLIDFNQDVIPQLADIPLLTDDGVDLEQAWIPFFKQLQIPLQKRVSKLHVGDSNMLVEPILCKQGMSLLRFSLIYDLLEKQQLICPLPFYFQTGFSYYLVGPENHFRYQKVQHFQQWLMEEMSEIGQHWQRFSVGNLEEVNIHLEG